MGVRLSSTPNAHWLTHTDINDVPLERTQRVLAAMWTELTPFGYRPELIGNSCGATGLLVKLLVEDGCAEAPARLLSIGGIIASIVFAPASIVAAKRRDFRTM